MCVYLSLYNGVSAVGAWFDHTSVETSTALGYKLMVFNSDQSRLKLIGDVVHIAMNDSYSVS